jgi:EAL domain-containing protein (putative c-di-GMP-specific phosphodiesterase class I)
MLMEMEFPELVRQALETWDVPPESLTFEISESAMIADVDRSLPILQRLRDMDVRLSVDDFGTGYSSLAYLKLLPVQELKIDKLFVANMGISRGDTQIVQSMIELAHSFGMSALAEGVENDECLADLRKMNCDLAQGYHFSPALPHADFMLWIGSRSA